MGNVPPHTAQAHGHGAGIGVCRNQGGKGAAADIHIHAAHNNGIPFLIIRAISDKADDSATEDYPTFEAKAINHTVNLVCGLTEKLA